jgi:hypothetical protein
MLVHVVCRASENTVMPNVIQGILCAATYAPCLRLLQFQSEAPLEAASILAFWMFFLALDELSPYSARRARLVLFETGRRACSIQF